MNKNIFDLEKEIFLPTYKRIPVEIDYGDGVYLYDKKGNRYLDLFAGLAVNALGYAHPGIVKAVTSQISKFGHISNSYITDIQIEFTRKLLKYSDMQKAFLTNSGTEAVEAAIKLIRKIKGPDKQIIAFSGSFHGRTYGALTLTERKKYRDGFEPLLQNVKHLPFNDISSIDKNINDSTAAVFIELIQGEGGINEASKEFITRLNELRHKYNFLLAVDEIQTGTGRTGYPFSYNIYNIIPDVVVTAKAIGGGLPLGALLTSNELNNAFTTGTHGTTFGGNPVCCAAGKVVLEEVFENGIIEQVKLLGDYFKQRLEELQSKFPADIKEIRGKGFMLGIELNYDGEKLVAALRARGILVNVTNQNVIRLLPPLILKQEHIDLFLKQFSKVLGNVN